MEMVWHVKELPIFFVTHCTVNYMKGMVFFSVESEGMDYLCY